jgi:hypothetical protein
MQYLILTLASFVALTGVVPPTTNLEAVSKTIPVVSVTIKDDRADKIDTYFKTRSMPLAGYGAKFVKEADRCGIDWRLIPAIGVRESSGGKRMMNNNPFGWGSAKIAFKNFDEAIEVVTSNMCGENPNTARYYKDTDTMEKLYWYNGTVMPSYPKEVMSIMKMIENTVVNTNA